MQEGVQLTTTRLLGRGLIDYLDAEAHPAVFLSAFPPGTRFCWFGLFGSHLYPLFTQRILICKFYLLINACIFLSSELVWDSFYQGPDLSMIRMVALQNDWDKLNIRVWRRVALQSDGDNSAYPAINHLCSQPSKRKAGYISLP